MSLKNWYPFYVGDYMRDTAKLSMVEHGAYRLLLDEYYSTGEALPDKIINLYRVCRAFEETEKEAIKNVLKIYFQHDNKKGVYRHTKVEQELKKRDDISEKRKQAIEKRWKNEKYKCNTSVDTKPHSKRIPSTSTSTSTSTNTSVFKGVEISNEITLATEMYNDMAEQNKLPKVQKLSRARKAGLKKRIEDAGGIKGWQIALEKLQESSFCLGDNDRGWKADFDFLIRESSFIKLMEGRYDNTERKKNDPNDELKEFLERERSG